MEFLPQIGYLLILIAIVAGIIYWLRIQPTNDANWEQDQKILAFADINKDFVTVHNIRNFKYKTEKEYTPAYYNKTFDVKTIKSVDFVFVPYSKRKILAHTFLTFGFNDGSYLSVSVEIRKKVGQEFSAINSLFKQYELMYVIADENDVIKLRTNIRHEPVHLYPAKVNKEQVGKLFLGVLLRANELGAQPEFYSLFNNTCTTEIAKQVRQMAPEHIPFSYKVLFPGYTDRLAYDLGLINTELPFAEARKKYFINERAMEAGDAEFSNKIRR